MLGGSSACIQSPWAEPSRAAMLPVWSSRWRTGSREGGCMPVSIDLRISPSSSAER
jgi:hypothetical protein